MYAQSESKKDGPTDKSRRAARDYSRAATMVLDLRDQTGTRRSARPEKWISGNLKLVIWLSATATITINLIDDAGVSTQAFSQSVTSTREADEVRFNAPISFDSKVVIIETIGSFDSMRIEYVPRNRQ